MSDRSSRFVEDRPYRPQMTDKDVAEMRAVLGRGLDDEKLDVEVLESFYDASRGEVIGCAQGFPFEDLAGTLDKIAKEDLTEKEIFDKIGLGTIVRFTKIAPSQIMFRNGTACLLRYAGLAERLAKDEVFNRSPETFFSLVGLIVDISSILIKRTNGKYRSIDGMREFMPLDKAILRLSPMKDFQNWKNLFEKRRDVISGKSLVLTPISIKQPKVEVEDSSEWQSAMDAVERRLESDQVKELMKAGATGDMREVNKFIVNLKNLKFRDIEAQTRARYGPLVRDDPVYEHVNLMIYHSVVSVLLDKEGNPAFLSGFPYALLIPDPGIPMERRMQSDGLWLSTGRLADYQLRVDGKHVQSILFGGVGGLIEPGMGFSWEHEVHTRLQKHVDFNGFHAVPVIVVKEARESKDFSVFNAVSSFDDIAERTGKYLFAEIKRRLEHLYDNYEEILTDLGRKFVEDLIVSQVKEWAKNYIVKKIGKKLIPGLNLLSLAADLTDKDEIERTRAAVACVVMSVKSSRSDDLTISAKVLSKIGVDKVQEAAVNAIQNAAKKKLVKKAEQAFKSKQKSDPKPDPAKSGTEAKPPPQDPKAATPSTATPATVNPKDVRATNQPLKNRGLPTKEDIEEGKRVAEQLRNAQAQARSRNDATSQKQTGEASKTTSQDSKQTREHLTDSNATHMTSTGGNKSPKKRKNPPAEPPLPNAAASVKEKLDHLKKNKGRYPEAVQKRIEEELKKAESRKPRGVSRKTAVRLNSQIHGENQSTGKKLPKIPENASSEERIKFMKKNRDKYPAAIRKEIDKEIKRAEDATQNAGSTEVQRIESQIQEHYAGALENDLGIRVKRVKKREVYRSGDQKGEDKPGTDTEKTNISERTGKRPQLSVVSETKDKEEVELDDVFVDEKGKLIAREYKSSLEIKQKSEELSEHDIETRMEKQSRWAEEYDARYEWVYHSSEDAKKMYKAKAALLEKAGANEKLKEQYKRIEIVPNPYDE